MRFRGFDEHFTAGIKGAESGLNGFSDFACRFATAGRHNIPEKRMVCMSTAAVDNGLSEVFRHPFNISEHAFKGHVHQVVTLCDRRIELIDVALMVFSVMDFHCAFVNMRFKRIVGVR